MEVTDRTGSTSSSKSLVLLTLLPIEEAANLAIFVVNSALSDAVTFFTFDHVVSLKPETGSDLWP